MKKPNNVIFSMALAISFLMAPTGSTFAQQVDRGGSLADKVSGRAVVSTSNTIAEYDGIEARINEYIAVFNKGKQILRQAKQQQYKQAVGGGGLSQGAQDLLGIGRDYRPYTDEVRDNLAERIAGRDSSQDPELWVKLNLNLLPFKYEGIHAGRVLENGFRLLKTTTFKILRANKTNSVSTEFQILQYLAIRYWNETPNRDAIAYLIKHLPYDEAKAQSGIDTDSTAHYVANAATYFLGIYLVSRQVGVFAENALTSAKGLREDIKEAGGFKAWNRARKSAAVLAKSEKMAAQVEKYAAAIKVDMEEARLSELSRKELRSLIIKPGKKALRKAAFEKFTANPKEYVSQQLGTAWNKIFAGTKTFRQNLTDKTFRQQLKKKMMTNALVAGSGAVFGWGLVLADRSMREIMPNPQDVLLWLQFLLMDELTTNLQNYNKRLDTFWNKLKNGSKETDLDYLKQNRAALSAEKSALVAIWSDLEETYEHLANPDFEASELKASPGFFDGHRYFGKVAGQQSMTWMTEVKGHLYEDRDMNRMSGDVLHNFFKRNTQLWNIVENGENQMKQNQVGGVAVPVDGVDLRTIFTRLVAPVKYKVSALTEIFSALNPPVAKATTAARKR